MTQRWNDLLYAHWPVAADEVAARLPKGLEPDLFSGSAWLGIVPFWMDRIKFRGAPPIPGVLNFPALNLRTYVRDRQTGTPGFYFFSLDASNLIAVLLARGLYRLPCHWAEMQIEQRAEREFSFDSRRRFSLQSAAFSVRYRGLGPTRKLAECRSGTLEYFLMERTSLFSGNSDGETVRSILHPVPWPLEEAEAVIERNSLAEALGMHLPDQQPVLHYARRLALYIWPTERVRPMLATRPVTVAATPSG
jgi:uncharacterized protein YqjF (DUF2071 family)